MSELRIASAQINLTVGDLTGNRKIIISFAKQAKEMGADLVVFPELAVSGYPPEDLLLRKSFLLDCKKSFIEIVQATASIPTVMGFPDLEDGKVYNAAAFSQDGVVCETYHKIELPNYGVFDEKRYFSPGTECCEFTLNGKRIMLTICEDVWVKDGVISNYATTIKPDIVLNISASPFHAGKLSQRIEVLSNFCSKAGVQMCYANIVGGQDELVFDGGCMAIDRNGNVQAISKRFEESLDICNFPVDDAPKGNTTSPYSDSVAEVYDALVIGTRDYTRKTGFKSVVIGLSGGIDSALVAAIATDALGNENVTGVTMPSEYTSNETFSDAEQLAENLQISLMKIPIHNIFKAYCTDLADYIGTHETGVAFENIQARIRGNILMALSNHSGWLVLTTGNKSEVAVGYCTLYGDMAGGFAVIKDVPKTLVYKLALHVNNKAGREIIPAGTIERAPSAELRPNQKDEDSLPPYGVLDKILKAYVESDKSPDEIRGTDFDEKLVYDILNMVDRNEYKRRQAAPGVKITPRAFGRDRRIPVANKYRNIY